MKPLSKLCECCGERFERPPGQGMARWGRKVTCGKPECVQAVKKRSLQWAMGSR